MKPIKKASEMTVKELAAYIDQSVLKPEFTQADIKRYIREAIDFGCKTVCINPSSLDIAHGMLKEKEIKICIVCDFPFGTGTTEARVNEAETYCKSGDIYELDLVANYGMIRSGLYDEVEKDIKAVTEICHKYGTAVKVILETDALTEEQIVKGTEIVINAGADFVKTSTGFYTGGEVKGAVPELIKLMMNTAKGRIKIKGSGCIRTREHFLQLIDMGIDRMGIGFRSTPVVLGIGR